MGLPKGEVKAAIHQGIRDKWDQWWDRYKHARQTKFFYPTQNKSFGKEVMNFTRFQLSRYIQIVTGHNNLLYHRSNINPDIDQTCRFCGVDKETFIHFFTDCPALWRAREEAEHARPGGHLDFVNPTQLLNFSFSPRINQALENAEEVDAIWEEMDLATEGDSVTSTSDMAISEVEEQSGADEPE